jgi:hypothetical protein
MTSAQNRAVKGYRKRQKEKGVVRVEVNVPEVDKPLIRQLARNLRSGGQAAENTRAVLAAALNPYEGMNLKQLLENSPLDELELVRSRESWRDVEL